MEFGNRDIHSKEGYSNTNTPLTWWSKRKRWWRSAKGKDGKNGLKVNNVISAGNQDLWNTFSGMAQEPSLCGNFTWCPFSTKQEKRQWQGKCEVPWCSPSLCHFLLGPTGHLLSFRCPVSDRKGRWIAENWRGEKTTERRDTKMIGNCSCNTITEGEEEQSRARKNTN